MTNPTSPQSEAEPHSVRRAGLGFRVAGYLCLLVATGIAGYLGWLLWGTGLKTQHLQDNLRKTFDHELSAPSPSEGGGQIQLGAAYGELQIPRLNLDMIVVQGTTWTILESGPGHYLDTANPWDSTGRVGIAGHRTTYLHPFFSLNKMKPGDPIIIRTTRGTYRYSVTRVFVLPASTAGVVLDQTQSPTLVLTTCDPIYSAADRLIVTANRISATNG
jgi:LPXTG-site transpeptidase (sortase) family protein